jgi:hypothetical protein
VRKFLRKILLGITLPTEYVTARRGDLPQALKTVITANSGSDVNDQALLFLGYKIPLVGIVTSRSDDNISHRIFNFALKETVSNEVLGGFSGRTGPEIALGEKRVTIAQAFLAQQWIESEIHQSNTKFFGLFRKNREDNIHLTKQEYDFLKMQYSIPREIRIAIVTNGDQYNLFPIDLFGFAGDEYMILSLRHKMKSCAQVESTRRIAIWTADAKYAREVYALGKNHSAEYVSEDQLPFTGEKSPVFNFPAPQYGMEPEEFEFLHRIAPDYAHHRLLILKRVGNKAEPNENALVHIHRAYAEWLLKQGFSLKQISR